MFAVCSPASIVTGCDKAVRNPFRIRASQRSVSDEEFVKLFGAGALDLVEGVPDPWDGLVFLRSAPGGGKTTILRLLTPRPLDLTSRLVDNPQVKATYDALRKIDAIGDHGSRLLGTMVAFTTEYRDLAAFDRGNSLFRALLDSRIVIATLRSVLERSQRPYPDDLDRIEIEWAAESGATIPAKADGRRLFEWASEIERGFYDRMDELGEPEAQSVGHPRLDALKWFARCRIWDGGKELSSKRVLLLDELQTLAPSQRQSLTEFVTNARENCGVWIAERLEALTHSDLLSEGALQGRDYENVIQLERQWAGGPRAKAYSRLVENIASLRAAKAEGFENRDFLSLIGETDDSDIWAPRFEEACSTIERRLISAPGSSRYSAWIGQARRSDGTPTDQAIRWRSAEILIERDRSRSQGSFDFDTLPTSDYDKKESAIIKDAEHFLRSEIAAPIYFGKEALSAVSSSNVDQYLEVAGALFEEISAKIKGPRDLPVPLSADRQDAIIRDVAKQRWDGLNRRLPRGPEARKFLAGLCEFCRAQTFRPTAPYSPGVTGFGITMADRALLIDSPPEKIRHFLNLRDVLTSLVAHNLLVPRVDHRNSGKSLVVFYLNRLLCVQFGLPLGYGGWREKSLRDLQDWLQHGAIDKGASGEPSLV